MYNRTTVQCLLDWTPAPAAHLCLLTFFYFFFLTCLSLAYFWPVLEKWGRHAVLSCSPSVYKYLLLWSPGCYLGAQSESCLWKVPLSFRPLWSPWNAMMAKWPVFNIDKFFLQWVLCFNSSCKWYKNIWESV